MEVVKPLLVPESPRSKLQGSRNCEKPFGQAEPLLQLGKFNSAQQMVEASLKTLITVTGERLNWEEPRKRVEGPLQAWHSWIYPPSPSPPCRSVGELDQLGLK
jgi:hypothetical protein